MALPSEILEPILAGAFSLCLRQLLRSPRQDADFERLVDQVKALDRVAICNQSESPWNDPNGTHASLACSNLWRQAMNLRDAPNRLDVLQEIEAGERASYLSPT